MTSIRYAALALSGGLIALPAHAAPFAYGHFYLGDGGNPDILEYDASHRFVRSFEAALPPGQGIDQVNHLRWGANGDLFAWGRFDEGSGPRLGVMEWNGNGTLARFTPYDLSGSEVWGFETAADGG
ncbi:MAG: hypothetical protein IT509_11705 [Rhodocyclaceae bacterium]|nr:hypothetical protein [Rhodocyclaceae bacterium]